MADAISLPLDKVVLPFQRDIENLAEGVYSHPALNNQFYKLWRTKRLPLRDFQIFGTNYFRRVYATTQRISIALSTITDWESRIELLHNLSDELGHGVGENVHVLVLYRWLDSLNQALGSPSSFRVALDEIQLLPNTKNFIAETNELCRRSAQHAAGAILAQEWHGYTQIAYLLEGFRLYQALYDFHNFHDVSEYFYVHLGRAEKEHKLQATKIATRHCHSAADFDEIAYSFNSYMQLLEDFWTQIAENLQCLQVGKARTVPSESSQTKMYCATTDAASSPDVTTR